MTAISELRDRLWSEVGGSTAEISKTMFHHTQTLCAVITIMLDFSDSKFKSFWHQSIVLSCLSLIIQIGATRIERFFRIGAVQRLQKH